MFLFVYLSPHRLHKIKFAENKIFLQIQSAFDILSTDNSKTLLYNRWMDGWMDEWMDGWMDDAILRAFQLYFSYMRTMDG